MPNGQKKRGKRRPRGPRNKRSSPQNSFIIQAAGAVISIILVIFLKTAGIINDLVAIIICMVILSAMFYLMFANNPKPRRSRNIRSKNTKKQVEEPQFYTALPSTLGLTDIPETPTPQVKLPPRPIRAARRRRDFITYPLSVGGGDYSDSYVQVDKDTVLRLRSEMVPGSLVRLPGTRIQSFPSAKEASVMSTGVDSETAVEPVVPGAAPVTAVEPVVPSAAPVTAVEPVVPSAAPVTAVEPVVPGAAPVTAVEPVVPGAAPVAAEEPAVTEAASVGPVVTDVVSTGNPVIQSSSEDEEEEMEFDMEWD